MEYTFIDRRTKTKSSFIKRSQNRKAFNTPGSIHLLHSRIIRPRGTRNPTILSGSTKRRARPSGTRNPTILSGSIKRRNTKYELFIIRPWKDPGTDFAEHLPSLPRLVSMLTGWYMLLLRSRKNYLDRISDDVMPLRSRCKTIPV